MLKCLILLSFIGFAFGKWQFNIFEVDENGGPGEVVVDLAKAIKNAEKYTSLTFELFGEHDMFAIEGTELLTRGPLDRETKGFYNITVKTLNNNEPIEELLPQEIIINVVDINDNSPVIDKEQTKFYVSENIETGDKAFHVEASDKDEGANAKLHYLLNCTRDVTDDDVTNDCPFVIHQNGDVTLSSRLDREARDEYKVVVTVTDCVDCRSYIKRRADQSEFGVSVEDENDNAPYFDWNVKTVEVAENATYNTEILKLNAKDKDLGENSEMTYQLLNNQDEIFFVDNKGLLRVKQSLDYENRDEYNLVVKVSNRKPLVLGVKTSDHDEANIKIKVLDVNEPPVLLEDSKNVQVPKDAVVGSKVAKLNAKDPERDAFNFEGSNKYFSVNSNGDVVLKSQLNDESEKRHELQVTLKDESNGNNENTEIVFVQVLDVNDNVPRTTMLNESRVLTLCQNNHNASQVLKGVLKASDEDSLDVNGNLFTFSQDPTDQTYNGNFQLFNRDGQGYIRTVRGDFDKSVTDKYTLRYIISDNGNPKFKATYNVEVNVCECGENGNCVTSGLSKGQGSGSVNTIVIVCCVLLAVVLIVLSAFFYQRSRRDKVDTTVSLKESEEKKFSQEE